MRVAGSTSINDGRGLNRSAEDYTEEHLKRVLALK